MLVLLFNVFDLNFIRLLEIVLSRLKWDICALAKMTRFLYPPKVVRRLDSVGVVAYGFGGASGKGFGHELYIGRWCYAFGIWIMEYHLQENTQIIKN